MSAASPLMRGVKSKFIWSATGTQMSQTMSAPSPLMSRVES